MAKIIVAINHMGGGGAETHALRVVNYLDRSRYTPVLALTRLGGSYEPFIKADVRVEKLSFGNLKSSTANLFLSPGRLIPLVHDLKPAAVLLVMDVMGVVGVASLLAMRGPRPKIVPVVQAPPSIAQQDTIIGRNFAIPGIRHLYHRADRVISLSEGVREDLESLDPRIAPKVTVIPNACVDERLEASLVGDVLKPKVPVVLAAGRLAPQKGFPYLLDAFPEVHRRTGAELWIIGEGPDRPALESQIERLGMNGVIRLWGFQKDPFKFMRQASVFCLSSVFEGFGNVIVEAMACGAPVVSTDCPYGPNEIITDGQDGLLVPVRDPRALTNALAKVLEDGALRARLIEQGRTRAGAFHARVVADRYADELDRIVAS